MMEKYTIEEIRDAYGAWVLDEENLPEGTFLNEEEFNELTTDEKVDYAVNTLLEYLKDN